MAANGLPGAYQLDKLQLWRAAGLVALSDCWLRAARCCTLHRQGVRLQALPQSCALKPARASGQPRHMQGRRTSKALRLGAWNPSRRRRQAERDALADVQPTENYLLRSKQQGLWRHGRKVENIAGSEGRVDQVNSHSCASSDPADGGLTPPPYIG